MDALDVEELELELFPSASRDLQSESEAEEEESGPGVVDDDAAWTDSDNEVLEVDLMRKNSSRKLRKRGNERNISAEEYERRLRQRFESTKSGRPSWASKALLEVKESGNNYSDDEEIEESEKVFQSSSALTLSASSANLTPEHLQISRVKDANQQCYSQGVIEAVEFHPKKPLLMTAAGDGRMNLFHVDGVHNPKVGGVVIEKFPILNAQFSPKSGSQVVMTAKKKKHYYIFDTETQKISKISGIRGRSDRFNERVRFSSDGEIMAFHGDQGYVNLVSTRTHSLLGSVKMNGGVRDIQFPQNGREMVTYSTNGEVYIWDIAQRKCITTFIDQGAIHGRCLAVDSSDEYLACGSDSGVVNLYTYSNIHSQTSQSLSPLKSFMNLSTAIHTIQFNHDSNIMAIASNTKRDALKMIHIPSKRVFTNWPTSKTPLAYVQAVAFSPNGGYCAIGNDAGKILLYRIKHYAQC